MSRSENNLIFEKDDRSYQLREGCVVEFAPKAQFQYGESLNPNSKFRRYYDFKSGIVTTMYPYYKTHGFATVGFNTLPEECLTNVFNIGRKIAENAIKGANIHETPEFVKRFLDIKLVL